MILCQTYKDTACYVRGRKVIDPHCNLSRAFVAYPYVQRSSRIHVVISEMKGKWVDNCQSSVRLTVRLTDAVLLSADVWSPHFSSPSHLEPESLSTGMQLDASILLQYFLSFFMASLMLWWCPSLNWLLQPCSMYVHSGTSL